MRGPFDKTLVHEAPRRVLRVDLHQHVGVGIVARCRHDVVLRTVVVIVVVPLVLMAGDDKLNGVLIFPQQRMQTVVGELRWLVLNERIVDEDEGRLVLL